MFFSLLILPVQAVEVLVIPADLLQTKENYYNFDEASEIIAKDIIKEFNKPESKIKTQDLYEVRKNLNNNLQLKQSVQNLLSKNKIDYSALKPLADNFKCNYILLVNSTAVTNKNELKRRIWEVLEVSTEFNISYPYRLETSVILVDTENSLVVWSNNFSTKLGTNSNEFRANNYAQANAEYEKIKLYSQSIVAPSTVQNISLRFFPKSIRPLQTEIDSQGGALRFEHTLPEKPNLKPRENFYGDTIFGI